MSLQDYRSLLARARSMLGEDEPAVRNLDSHEEAVSNSIYTAPAQPEITETVSEPLPDIVLTPTKKSMPGKQNISDKKYKIIRFIVFFILLLLSAFGIWKLYVGY